MVLTCFRCLLTSFRTVLTHSANALKCFRKEKMTKS
jgi:hypothetical protein